MRSLKECAAYVHNKSTSDKLIQLDGDVKRAISGLKDGPSFGGLCCYFWNAVDRVRLHYKEIYGSDADTYLEKVNKDFRDVYDAYAATDSSNSKSYRMLDTATGWPSISSPKSELDLYMKQLKVPAVEEFDVLAWWRGNAPFYPTLARMARDYLAFEVPFFDEDDECALNDLLWNIDVIKSKFRFCDLPEIITPLLCLRGFLARAESYRKRSVHYIVC